MEQNIERKKKKMTLFGRNKDFFFFLVVVSVASRVYLRLGAAASDGYRCPTNE
jgi:hypothetical protein